MAISMSGATVESDERDALLQSEVDGSATSGGASANTSGGLFGIGASASGASLAGVTASFAANVTGNIDSYCDGIKTAVDALTTVEVNVAFKGTEVEAALNTFVEDVKTVADNYVEKLRSAENQIINSVGKAYETQDTDLGGNVTSDGSSLEGSNQ